MRGARSPRTMAGVTGTETLARDESATCLAPRWNVVLLDDDDHTYDYVIEMLGRVCGLARAVARRMAEEVDASGRCIVWTGPLEVAEFKRERIHAFGADPRLARSAGSMSAELEPVE